MGDFDAVVAGGGPNGLAAALRLAEAGWSVCLVEANQDVGGVPKHHPADQMPPGGGEVVPAQRPRHGLGQERPGRLSAVWVPVALRSLLMPPDRIQMGLDFAFERLPNPRNLLGGQLCSLLVSHGRPGVGESSAELASAGEPCLGSHWFGDLDGPGCSPVRRYRPPGTGEEHPPADHAGDEAIETP